MPDTVLGTGSMVMITIDMEFTVLWGNHSGYFPINV